MGTLSSRSKTARTQSLQNISLQGHTQGGGGGLPGSSPLPNLN
jgi:hypothetical protein